MRFSGGKIRPLDVPRLAFPSRVRYIFSQTMINASEAQRIILNSLSPSPSESCGLRDSLHRIVSEDVIAPGEIPAFDNSGMDGYAVLASDTLAADSRHPVTLHLQGESYAGLPFPGSLLPKHAIRITTGGAIPKDADAVVEQELITQSNGSIEVPASVEKGRNIRRRGDDVAAGSVVLKKGSRITPAGVGVLASLGIQSLRVCRKIRVSVLATGNEVVDFDRELKPGQIRNSNAIALEAMLKEDGHEAILLGTARDNPDDLAQKITMGFETDALITSGGVSVGDHDFMMKVFETLGMDLKFWKINIRPGMPMAFGLAQNSKPVFALPGNPVSTLVTYRQFVRPGLLKMAGLDNADRTVHLQATLSEDIRKVDGKRHFVRGVCSSAGNRLEVRATGSQSSAVLTSLVKANCLIILPEEKRNPTAGESVEIELL